MTGNGLRISLVKSVVLLGILSLFVYLTAVSPEGSVWASLGTLFMAVFRIIQLSIGLVISLLFCLAVLTGIFLGGIAFVSRESAAKMWQQLRQEISNTFLYAKTVMIKGAAPLENLSEQNDESVNEKIQEEISIVKQLSEVEQSNTLEKITALHQRIDEVENRLELDGMSQKVEQHEQAIREFTKLLDSTREGLAQLHSKVDELAGHVGTKDVSGEMAQITHRIEELHQANASLQQELLEVKTTLADMDKKSGQDKVSPSGPAGHRLFVYLSTQAMQEKVEQLVTETLETDMSYAQVIDHLITNTKGKTADIIKAHPKLAKNYIRYRRENG